VEIPEALRPYFGAAEIPVSGPQLQRTPPG